ncbi:MULTISPECIES: 4'-phosphopantetheinyl transferase superfamily protein [Thermoactinomyces]|uniref:4'-phosphopantetheinyl transferase superfamily protein n=1 Tax=Thermoactinomyces daqus TaxID=1329516 RepID=A0A7W1XBB5_9BACL|nr:MULTISPECIES: 4'-phosphopantetheinyl transferase superfamily protein [Thermoactinomyces]MBA4543501.1 4'-phosphopantetheinyl transferase superfamily protein [Thermoactinomyces daqus]MBH8598734.1 4'-phosphopantetheinyl transferase superfamily protein [Thermoactinomyces sp. CICC 10523]MBH8605514.1 4'-phosphopantetheinyl transferase superfamily protein [Thermoactinomyces sp. CICC 10522]MBH8608798.1 4'-phosphopantetheinyl transferase superfamily protein [Thermoactinomyces sp. CICC 10521]
MMASDLPETWTAELILKGMDRNYMAGLCLCYSRRMMAYMQTVKFLQAKEREYFDTLQFERRIKSYLAGRYAGKRAVSFLIGEEKPERVLIEHGIFHQPVAVYPGSSKVQVSITHCDDLGAAIAFPEAVPMGIDIERICPEKKDVLERQLTVREQDLAKSIPFAYETALTLFWTVKESMSKVLKTGLTSSVGIFLIEKTEINDRVIVSHFVHFPQYCAASFIFEPYICSIAYPKRAVWETGMVRDLLDDLSGLLKGGRV